MTKYLDVKIQNSHPNRDKVEDLVKAFVDAGKVTPSGAAQAFIRFEASCNLTAEDSVTQTDLDTFRHLGAAANIRTKLSP